MFIKLGLIVGIIILGGIVFSSEITNLFPNSSAAAANSLKDDVSNLSAKAIDSAEKKVSESFDNVVRKTNDTVNEEIGKAGDKITNKVSEAKESSQAILQEEISKFNPIKSIQNFFTENSEQ